MKITDEAKTIIVKALEANDCDCLQVTLEQSCCGMSLNFGLVKLKAGEKPASVNDIPVLMDIEAIDRAETVTIAAEDGELVIQDDTASCCC